MSDQILLVGHNLRSVIDGGHTHSTIQIPWRSRPLDYCDFLAHEFDADKPLECRTFHVTGRVENGMRVYQEKHG